MIDLFIESLVPVDLELMEPWDLMPIEQPEQPIEALLVEIGITLQG